MISWFVSLSSCSIVFTLQAVVPLHLDLDVFAFEPLDHELVLLAWRKPGPHRLPGPAGPDAAVFRLGDADEAFLRDVVDCMVVALVAPLEFPGDGVLAWQ